MQTDVQEKQIVNKWVLLGCVILAIVVCAVIFFTKKAREMQEAVNVTTPIELVGTPVSTTTWNDTFPPVLEDGKGVAMIGINDNILLEAIADECGNLQLAPTSIRITYSNLGTDVKRSIAYQCFTGEGFNLTKTRTITDEDFGKIK